MIQNTDYRNNRSPDEQRSDFLSIVEELKAIIAHDIRAPIASVTGLLYLLVSENCTREDRERALGHLFSTVKKLDDHTREAMQILLDLEKGYKSKNCDDRPGGP